MSAREKFGEAIKDFWREVGPFFRHGVSIAFVVLIAAGIVKLLTLVLSTEAAHALDEIDLFLVKALFWLFGGYTFFIIANRLVHFLWKELASTWRRQPQGPKKNLSDGVRNTFPESSASENSAPDELLLEVRALRDEVAQFAAKYEREND